MLVEEDCWAHVLCWRGSGWTVCHLLYDTVEQTTGRLAELSDYIRSLLRMNASSLCRSVALVKPHQALEAYVSLAVTTDRYTVCRSLSSMPWARSILKTYKVWAHELITACTCSATATGRWCWDTALYHCANFHVSVDEISGAIQK